MKINIKKIDKKSASSLDVFLIKRRGVVSENRKTPIYKNLNFNFKINKRELEAFQKEKNFQKLIFGLSTNKISKKQIHTPLGSSSNRAFNL